MSKLTPTVLLSLLTVITATQFGSSAQAATEIFVLGGEALPNSTEISAGDKNVTAKENQYLAAIGVEPGTEASERPRTSSKNGSGGYSDSDVM
ncbi:hypothetical protein [Chamaesiphon sp.]|uniref:hypothetical protein n=1 Tax=Chamaesiphon sp. TaxID=2814140 RepID=UPI0035943C85